MYEYECECGAIFEVLERFSEQKTRCESYCKHLKKNIPEGFGSVTRCISTVKIRGDGKEAKEPSFDPVKKANRPYSDCHHDH